MMIVSFLAGLVVGWNFLKQPQFVADFIASLTTKKGS